MDGGSDRVSWLDKELSQDNVGLIIFFFFFPNGEFKLPVIFTGGKTGGRDATEGKR